MGQFKRISTGNLGALNAAVTIETRQLANSAAGVQITGTFSGTILIEATMDGANWGTYAFINCASGATETSITAVGQFRTELVACVGVRARMSAYTSGTAVATVAALDN